MSSGGWAWPVLANKDEKELPTSRKMAITLLASIKLSDEG